MTVPDNHDPTVVQSMEPTAYSFPDLPQPINEDLRPYTRVPRAKSAGIDGVHPYLYYLLTTDHFRIVANAIRLTLLGEAYPSTFAAAKVIGLYKGQGSWDIARK